MLGLVLIALCALPEAIAYPAQAVLEVPVTSKPRKLHGRFLHITDMHPDGHYSADASQSSACHRAKPRKEKERSGYYGTPFSGCDSPLRLTNFTLDFLDKQWSSDIDFVIWTGDNARHDNDRKVPRTPTEIYTLNRAVAAKMEKVFLSKGIPVVPSLGNNDVWPHNILSPGPNRITNEYSSIWSKFIPFPSYLVFQRGAYFAVEVIPNAVAVISLNTMYFYDSNKAVRGCEYAEVTDPGNLEFDWLEVQLKSYRERGMQVWLSGHVPPSPGNYFPECYVRYVELSLRFQDTILGHLYGHMNADHFFFLESDDLNLRTDEASTNRTFQGVVREDLYETLLQDFASLPSSSNKMDYDDYAVINVSPSVVPNPYLPSFRVFSYNITGISSTEDIGTMLELEQMKRKHGHRRGKHGDKESQCKEAKYRDTWTCRLKEPWYSDPEAPSRQNTLWSPLGYAQYYLPNLEFANKTHRPKYKLEYLTFPVSALHPPAAGDAGVHGRPIPLRHLPRSLHNATITKSKYTPYRMQDLTIPSWLKLGRKLGNDKRKKLRRKFRKLMYMGGQEG